MFGFSSKDPDLIAEEGISALKVLIEEEQLSDELLSHFEHIEGKSNPIDALIDNLRYAVYIVRNVNDKDTIDSYQHYVKTAAVAAFNAVVGMFKDTRNGQD